MAIELEIKYAATPAQLDAILAVYGAPRATVLMETTYYDTPSGALSAHRYTLRRRLENGRSICTVKTPLPGLARGEWECEERDILRGVEKLCKLGCPPQLPELIREGLIPVCGARFTRQTFLLEAPGFTGELALDRGVLSGGGQELPLWEVELEWKAGAQSLLEREAGALAAQFGLQPQPLSKYQRAKALAGGRKNG